MLVAALVLVFLADNADARKRRHRQVIVLPPEALAAVERGQAERFRNHRGAAPPLSAAVPPGWQSQAPEANFDGKRFVSPDGAAWLAVYRVAAQGSVSDHMKAIAFAGNDEVLTYVHGERSSIAAAGFKGSRVFYRKAILACAGKVWHHVAFEYPPEIKDRMERFVDVASRALIETQTQCPEVASQQQ
jgi:hypothetical protein